MKILRQPAGKIDEKRFRLPGCIVEYTCPKCKKVHTRDLGGDDYLSFPVVNAPFVYDCYCSHCNHEWTVKAFLKVELAESVECFHCGKQAEKDGMNSVDWTDIRPQEDTNYFCSDCHEAWASDREAHMLTLMGR